LLVSDLKSFVIEDWISPPTELTVHPWRLVSKISPSYALYYYSRSPPCPPDFIGCRMETIADILIVKLYKDFAVNARQGDEADVLAEIENLL
jgi:hypothetical protein